MNSRLFISPFILSVLFCSCANNTTTENKDPTPEKYRGIQIKNAFPTGSIYNDGSGEKLGYRSVVVEFTNDTVIPAHLQLVLPPEFISLPGPANWKYKMFFLPDSIDKLYGDNDSLSKDLTSYLGNQSELISNLSKAINPGEKYKLKLGCLINPDGLARIAIFSRGHKHSLSIPDSSAGNISQDSDIELNLLLGITLNETYSVIPVGKILFQ